MVGQAEAQNFKQEGRAGINPEEQTQTNEFGDAKEALHAYESKVAREEEGGLVTSTSIEDEARSSCAMGNS
jgi:hypothetical protein